MRSAYLRDSAAISCVLTGVECTSASNGGFNQAIELLITADGELKVTRGDAFHLEIFAGIASQLKNLTTSTSSTHTYIHTYNNL